MCKGAIAVVAVGTCASYGGMPSDYAPDVATFSMEGAASHSPSGAMGFFPDPIKNQPGFVLKYSQYAHSGVLASVWNWITTESAVYTDALDPYYNFITTGGGLTELYRLPLTWNASIKPAVAVPGCPANGNAISLTLASLVLIYLKKKLSTASSSLAELLRSLDIYLPLDRYFRPEYVEVDLQGVRLVKFPLFVFRTHRFLRDRAGCVYTYVANGTLEQAPLLTGCPKFIYWKRKLLKEYPADGTPYCAFSVGCKGPESTCPWNAVGWIIDKDIKDTSKLLANTEAKAGCTKKSAPCIACVMPGFSEAYQPFFKPLRPIHFRGIIGGVGMGRGRTRGGRGMRRLAVL